jgi:hypothetical protein
MSYARMMGRIETKGLDFSAGQALIRRRIMEENTHPKRPFLLMEGGPLYRLEKRIGLVRGKAMLTRRRAGLSIVITWLPMLVLSIIQGTAFGKAGPVTFLHDFSVYTRFLLGVPLLLMAEVILGPRIAEAAEEFVNSGLLVEKDYQKFDAAVERGLASRDSVTAELILLILAYGVSIGAFRGTSMNVSSWYVLRSGAHHSLTWAGWWLIGISVPLLEFLVLRWIWRLFLWFRFLAQVSSLDIQLFPTHPDHAGGLGFVGEAQRFFGVLLFAYSILIAGVLANQLVYDKVPLQHFVPAIVFYVLVSLGVIVGPLVLFSGRLLKTKRVGLYQYGGLATAYSGSFHRKWIRREDATGEPLLGTADIQSLADLANSFGVIESMNPLPVSPRTIVQLVVASLLPMAPLLFAVIPLKDLLKILMKILA